MFYMKNNWLLEGKTMSLIKKKRYKSKLRNWSNKNKFSIDYLSYNYFYLLIEWIPRGPDQEKKKITKKVLPRGRTKRTSTEVNVTSRLSEVFWWFLIEGLRYGTSTKTG